MIKKLLISIIFLLAIPSNCYAWGPLTHVFLGSELLLFPIFVPASLYCIINRHKDDFLYGNIMADTILGKKYLPEDGNSHSWDFAFNLLGNSKNEHETSFCYGYLCHLAADTVAHEILNREQKNIDHTLYELKADSFVNKKYWVRAVAICKNVQRRNDNFLEGTMDTFMFSFKTNKRIFKSMVFMSIFSSLSFSSDSHRKRPTFSYSPDKDSVSRLQEESFHRMVDVLNYETRSFVVKKNPIGEYS